MRKIFTVMTMVMALVLSTMTVAFAQSETLRERPADAFELPEAVAGEYIVELAPDTDADELTMQTLDQSGTTDLFLAEVDDAELDTLRDDPQVRSVTPNHRKTTQEVPYGLDRIDQRELDLDGRFNYSHTGDDVRMYVVDTGIYDEHSEFEGRVTAGYNALTGSTDTTDCNGHGTHVAGTAAGSTMGVANQATIVPVKVLDCTGSGTLWETLDGLAWIEASHPGGPAVINMSIGGYANTLETEAVEGLLRDGFVVVAAAGNSGDLACDYGPGNVPGALTVTASDPRNDTQPVWANYGSCVDLYAPGVAINSAWPSGSGARKVLDGTSMSAPHVAGIAAVHLERDPSATAAQVHAELVGNATPGRIVSAQSPNLLAYAPYDVELEPEPLPAPSFSDVAGTTHETSIAALADAGVTSGYPDGTFRAGDSVTRGQMATFLVNALDLAPATGSGFTDIGGTTHQASIESLAASNITSGYADGTFRPDNQVTRGQMATFLAVGFGVPASEVLRFSDTAGTTHTASIAAVASAGIAGGYSDQSYRPDDTVTRGQMATFLARSLNLVPRTDPPPPYVAPTPIVDPDPDLGTYPSVEAYEADVIYTIDLFDMPGGMFDLMVEIFDAWYYYEISDADFEELMTLWIDIVDGEIDHFAIQEPPATHATSFRHFTTGLGHFRDSGVALRALDGVAFERSINLGDDAWDNMFTTWPGLFNVASVSDGRVREDVADLGELDARDGSGELDGERLDDLYEGLAELAS